MAAGYIMSEGNYKVGLRARRAHLADHTRNTPT
jgi:hypothetical protein